MVAAARLPCPPYMKMAHAEELQGLPPAHLWALSHSPEGSRTLQQMLETIGGEARKTVLAAFRGRVTELLCCPHGNHVLQKLVEVMPPPAARFIYDELSTTSGGWVGLCQQGYGCRVLQRIFEHFPSEWLEDVVGDIKKSVEMLARHPMGNFVLQSILEHGAEHQRDMIVTLLLESFRALAVHRISSHVIERAVCYGSQTQRSLFVRAALDSYAAFGASRSGNLVLRKITHHAMGVERRALAETLKLVKGRRGSNFPFVTYGGSCT